MQRPEDEGYLGILSISNEAAITSGNYERYFEGEDGQPYGHIIDPATGFKADNGLQSVTVVGKNGLLCDGLSTALFVMGLEEASKYWRENGGFEVIFVTEDGGITITEGLETRFSPMEDTIEISILYNN